MAATIRLTRVGTTKKPCYRIVVTSTRQKRDGRYVELLGHYQPLGEEMKLEIIEDRLLHYWKNGATISPTVRALCKMKGLKLTRPTAQD